MQTEHLELGAESYVAAHAYLTGAVRRAGTAPSTPSRWSAATSASATPSGSARTPRSSPSTTRWPTRTSRCSASRSPPRASPSATTSGSAPTSWSSTASRSATRPCWRPAPWSPRTCRPAPSSVATPPGCCAGGSRRPAPATAARTGDLGERLAAFADPGPRAGGGRPRPVVAARTCRTGCSSTDRATRPTVRAQCDAVEIADLLLGRAPDQLPAAEQVRRLRALQDPKTGLVPTFDPEGRPLASRPTWPTATSATTCSASATPSTCWAAASSTPCTGSPELDAAELVEAWTASPGRAGPGARAPGSTCWAPRCAGTCPAGSAVPPARRRPCSAG